MRCFLGRLLYVTCDWHVVCVIGILCAVCVIGMLCAVCVIGMLCAVCVIGRLYVQYHNDVMR